MRAQSWLTWACLAVGLAATAFPQVANADCKPINFDAKDVGNLEGDSCVPIERLPVIPAPHVEACSTTINDEIWVVSGAVNSYSNTGRFQLPTNRVDIYSPAKNLWYSGSPTQLGRVCYPNVFNVNGTLFLVGGEQETAPDSGHFVLSRQMEVCRPDGNGYNGLGVSIAKGDTDWHLLPHQYDMPARNYNIWNRSNAVVGSSLYLFTPLPSGTLRFDTATGLWTNNLATHAGANNNFSCAIALNDKIYVSGGCGGPSPGCPAASLFAEYNPATNTWRDLARFPAPGLAEHTMELVGQGQILVVGGDFNGTALYYYDPATNTMVERESKVPDGQDRRLYARSDHLSGIYNGKVYIVGGIEAGTRNVQPESLAIGLPL